MDVMQLAVEKTTGGGMGIIVLIALVLMFAGSSGGRGR